MFSTASKTLKNENKTSKKKNQNRQLVKEREDLDEITAATCFHFDISTSTP